ncbi:hypothetical protein C7450_10340 [Chelatococcus asaccharovorans]|uniref:AlpA family transcriptional regulator n=1 Tax=Chelatococcus asaccharovorans TaxID=28210 RepID=A0A2V3UAL0_9HYPH|nr:hypothetical protein C7450_10340 [Chelatococcus asaccharovorans]
MKAQPAHLTTVPGDPRRDFWTYPDLAQVFSVSIDLLRRKLMPQWEAADFPRPLPWCTREKRWNPAAVLAWKDRQERRNRSVPPELVPQQGGQS